MRCRLPIFLLLMLGACSQQPQVRDPFAGGGQAAATSIRINVDNNNFNEATVRAVSRTERRLGTVPGNGQASFNLAWPAVNDLRIQIDILAGDRYTTNRVTVSPGETVYLTIANPIYRSLLRR